MGWASGSELCDTIIRSVKRNVPDTKKRKNIYKATIRAFRHGDWDTEDECRGVDPVFDKALDEENERLGYEFDE